MTDQIRAELEELAKWFENNLSTLIAGNSCFEKAVLLRRAIALVPKEGEVVVPEEPTAKMMRAFWLSGPFPQKAFAPAYKAMLAARPKNNK